MPPLSRNALTGGDDVVHAVAQVGGAIAGATADADGRVHAIDVPAARDAARRELPAQYGAVERPGLLVVGHVQRDVRDVAFAQPGGAARRLVEQPAMTERIEQRSDASVRLVDGLALDRRTPLSGLAHRRVDIGHLHVDAVAVHRPGGRFDPEFGERVAEHEHGVADADLGVADPAIVHHVGITALDAR